MNTYRLSLPDQTAIDIDSATQLRSHLTALQGMTNGQIISLKKDDRDYINARAAEGLWEIWRRRGGWWTKQSFSAWLSSDWSERNAGRPFSLRHIFGSRDQIRFSQSQMIDLFIAHFSGEKYPYGYVGAN